MKTESLKLLGTIITDDLKWDKNTDYITKKAYARLELLRKLKKVSTSGQRSKKIISFTLEAY